MQMKGMLAALALCLLPVCSMAVTEGVVEEAPPVVLDWPAESDKLFGAWEDGLADIAASAQGVLSQRLGCPEGMRLYEVSMLADVRGQYGAAHFASASEEDTTDDQITAVFLYQDDAQVTWRAYAVYSRETGSLIYASKRRYYDGIDEANAGAPSSVDEARLKEIVSDYMKNVIGVSEFAFEPKENSQGADRIGRVVYLPGGTRYMLDIGKTTGEVLAVHMNDTEQADYFGGDEALKRRARRVLTDVFACPWEMVFSHLAELDRAKTLVFTNEQGGMYKASVTIDLDTGKILFAERVEDNREPQHRAKDLTDEKRLEIMAAYLKDTLGHAAYEFVGGLEAVGETTRQRVRLEDGTTLGLYLSETTGRMLRAEMYTLKGGEE